MSNRTIKLLATLKILPPRILRSNGWFERDVIAICPPLSLVGRFSSMLRTRPLSTSNCLRPLSTRSIVGHFRRRLFLLKRRNAIIVATARSIAKATVAGTSGPINTNNDSDIATRKWSLKLNCPLPLFTMIRSVVTYTVEPLNKPPAGKYPITLSFGETTTDHRP